MEKSEVDFVHLVELLLEDFDGSAEGAMQIRRATLKAVRDVPADHPLRDRLDRFTGALSMSEFVIEDSSVAAKWRADLLGVWHVIASEIRRAGNTLH